jgi:hypothetical protein
VIGRPVRVTRHASLT